MEMDAIAELRHCFPWPDQKPEGPADLDGWLHGDTATMLRKFLPTDGIVVELGTWLGMSAHFLAKHAGHLICVDHWLGSDEHQRHEPWSSKLPTLYRTCQINLWPQRDRITLVRADVLHGLQILASLGITPTLIYVDADHSEAAVLSHLRACHEHWPTANIVGDDKPFESVTAAVETFASETGRQPIDNEVAYAFEGLK